MCVNYAADLEGYNMIDNNKSLLNVQNENYEINLIIDHLLSSLDNEEEIKGLGNHSCFGSAIETGIDFLTT